jgi:hypothetical protein
MVKLGVRVWESSTPEGELKTPLLFYKPRIYEHGCPSVTMRFLVVAAAAAVSQLAFAAVDIKSIKYAPTAATRPNVGNLKCLPTTAC